MTTSVPCESLSLLVSTYNLHLFRGTAGNRRAVFGPFLRYVDPAGWVMLRDSSAREKLRWGRHGIENVKLVKIECPSRVSTTRGKLQLRKSACGWPVNHVTSRSQRGLWDCPA